MRTGELALVRGWADTRATLARWNRAPGEPVRALAPLSLAIALVLLAATWLRAELAVPDPGTVLLPGVHGPAGMADFGFVLLRNGLVLALHALACVAGFIAGSSVPQVAQGYSGAWRRLHELAAPLAIAFVVAATLFSLLTQADALGTLTATIAAQLGTSPATLLAIVSLHALPELFALFLPLAAWTVASRHGAWDELLAATFVTVAVAVPLLLLAGAVETWVTPRILATL